MLLNPLSLARHLPAGRMRLHSHSAGDSVLRLLRNLRSSVAAADAAFAAPRLKWRRILQVEFSTLGIVELWKSRIVYLEKSGIGEMESWILGYLEKRI